MDRRPTRWRPIVTFSFQREVRWMWFFFLAPAGIGILLALVIPWVMRLF